MLQKWRCSVHKRVDLLGRNLDKVVPVLVAGYTALKGYGVAKSAANTVSKLSKAYKVATVAVKGICSCRWSRSSCNSSFYRSIDAKTDSSWIAE